MGHAELGQGKEEDGICDSAAEHKEVEQVGGVRSELKKEQTRSKHGEREDAEP